MMNIQKTIPLVGLLCRALTISASSVGTLYAASSEKTFSKPFIDAAHLATPAVVAIKAEFGKGYPSNEAASDQTPDFGADEFWERFFGAPFNQPRKPKGPQYGYGSGFIISADGYVITNNHIAEKATRLIVLLDDGREFPATLIGTDPNTDVALIKVDATNLPFLGFADSSKLDIGEWVLAIGNPLGLKASVTAGVISAKERTELDITRVEEFIQTDAAINSGNSGGPLINLDGKVVGMNTAIVSSNGGGYMGICFAIPSNLIEHVVQQLKTTGKATRGYLGIAPQSVTPEIAKAFKLSTVKGALIAEIIPGGPASAAGLRSGDIILEVNGQTIENAGGFRNAIAMLAPGATVKLTVHRTGGTQYVTATVGEFPENEQMLKHVENSLGVEVKTLTPELASQVGTDAKTGVLITAVDPDSPAFLSGLRQGYVITAINQQPVTNTDEFYKAVKETAVGHPILLQIKIGLRTRFVTIVLR